MDPNDSNNPIGTPAAGDDNAGGTPGGDNPAPVGDDNAGGSTPAPEPTDAPGPTPSADGDDDSDGSAGTGEETPPSAGDTGAPA